MYFQYFADHISEHILEHADITIGTADIENLGVEQIAKSHLHIIAPYGRFLI